MTAFLCVYLAHGVEAAVLEVSGLVAGDEMTSLLPCRPMDVQNIQ